MFILFIYHFCFFKFIDPKTPPEMMQIYDAIRATYPSVKKNSFFIIIIIIIFSFFDYF